MRNNQKTTVIQAIAQTQDGKLKGNDDFNKFIFNRIEANQDDENEALAFIDMENLESDFRYMIHELEAALKPIKEFNEKWATA